jgi:glutathione peroxidase
LEKLYEDFKDRGLVVLGFPCNQFGAQEAGSDAEIAQFCELNYGVSFPIFSKIEVNGPNAHPLFQYLKKEKAGLLSAIGLGAIKWNFTKFLVDRSGKVVSRHAPATSPEQLATEIEKLLG